MNNKIIKKNIRILDSIRTEESGSVLIIVAVALAVFMVFLALTIDIGSAYLSTGQIQKAADAAVYSAGRKLPVSQNDTTAINAIKDSAISYAALNGYSGLTRSNVILGNIVGGNYTDIKVTTSKSVSMNFAKVIGINNINISRTAKAMLSSTKKTTNVTPLGIPDNELSGYLANNQYTHITLKYGKGGGSGGFFGALDLDGNGGGASDYRLWIAQGYPGEISVGDILYQENGNMVGPTYQGFQERYNGCTHYGAKTGGSGCTIEHYDPSCPRVSKVVVYSIYSSKTVRVSGFAAFILENQDQSGYITGSYVRTLTTGQGSGGGAGTTADFGLYNLMLSQ